MTRERLQMLSIFILFLAGILFCYLVTINIPTWKEIFIPNSPTLTPSPTYTPTVPPSLTITATIPPPFMSSVEQPSNCHNGPDGKYLISKIITAGTQVDILGKNSDGEDWFMVRGLDIDNCWIMASMLSNKDIDKDRLLIFTAAITESDTPCYSGPSDIYEEMTIIPPYWRIVIYGKTNSETNWVKVTPNFSTEQCWVNRKSLTDFDSSDLPTESFSTPTAVILDYPPVELSWKLRSFDCSNDGSRIMGVSLDLNVSGEPAPLSYNYSEDIPYYIQPNEAVAIKVSPKTDTGKSSAVISATFQSIVDTFALKCNQPGNNHPPPTDPLLPTDPPNPTKPPSATPKPTNPPPTPTLCWPPGHCK